MKPEPRAEGRRWLVQAENDLRFAELASQERFFAQAALWRRPLQPLVGPRPPGMGIIRPMTRALDTAIAKLTTLPADEQDRIAQWLLEELRDEEHWARQFAASQSTLSKLAAEARAERAAGRATELDPDKL